MVGSGVFLGSDLIFTKLHGSTCPSPPSPPLQLGLICLESLAWFLYMVFRLLHCVLETISTSTARNLKCIATNINCKYVSPSFRFPHFLCFPIFPLIPFYTLALFPFIPLLFSLPTFPFALFPFPFLFSLFPL